MAPQPLHIVLAEDDDGHATLVHRNLERSGLVNGFTRVKDGQEALDYFRGEGTFTGQTPADPILLLLDINMPRVDGVEVLRQLRQDCHCHCKRSHRAWTLAFSFGLFAN